MTDMLPAGSTLGFGFVLALGLAPLDAAAVPLPASGVVVETYAEIDTLPSRTEMVSDPFAAESDVDVPGAGANDAIARAEAQTYGPGSVPAVRSFNEVLDSTLNPIVAGSSARVITHWVANTDGSVVPVGSPVGLGTRLMFDGTLFANSGCCPTSLLGASAFVLGSLVLHTEAGATTVFQSQLTASEELEAPFQMVFGVSGTGPFLSSYDERFQAVTLAYDQDLEDLFSVTAGEAFALELFLGTNAMIGDFEEAGDNTAGSDFSGTGSFELFVSVPGVTLERLDPAVPEPSSLGLLAAGLLGRALLARAGRSTGG